VGLALYRKYRPATFADVVGQEHVTEPLRAALAAGRINHAYLFSGPRGCGKTSSARILARSLNCVQGPTPDPCGVCGSCVALAPEGPGSLDVVELDAASHGGVEDTRDLRDRAFYMPAESRFRVFIIDEAHMVTPQGFNALLKIVEEPPEHLVFIFATTEPDKVLTTIRSRTHHYPFRLIPPTTLRTLLERLCKEEGATVEPAVFPLVIRAGGGSARDSLSMLDQLLSGAGPEGVTYRHAVALLGVTDAALLDEMVDAIAAADGASVFGAVDKVVEAGHDPRRFAADLLQRLRDLLILDAVPDAAAKGLIDCPEDQLVSMAGQADRLGVATLTRLAEVMHTGLVEMRGTTSPRLVLELMCARMLLPAASADDGALLQRLERMERRMSIAADPAVERAGSGGSPPAPTGDPEPVPDRAQRPGTEAAARVANPRHRPGLGLPRRPAGPSAAATAVLASAPPTGRQGPARPQTVIEPTSAAGAESPASGLSPEAIDVTDVRRVWAEVLLAVQRNRRTTQVLLQPATIIGVEQGVLRLEMQSAALARLVVEPANADPLKAALREVLGVSWTVRCEAPDAGTAGQSGNAAATPPGTDRADRDRRNDPPPPPPEEDDIPDDYGEPIDPSAPPPVVRDPEEAAIELLTTELGARRLDPPA